MNALHGLPDINFDAQDTKGAWRLPPLYKASYLETKVPGTNETQIVQRFLFWQVGFDGVDTLTTLHGHYDGVIQESPLEVVLNKSKKTMQEQAFTQARQKYSLKCKDGYRGEMVSSVGKIAPMKAMSYTPEQVKMWPVYVQPKLDGVRLMVNTAETSVRLMSSKGNQFTHLHKIQEEVERFIPYLPFGTVLDGELYSHGMPFPKIISAVKTQKRQHEDLVHIQYWLFDIFWDNTTPFDKRYAVLVDKFAKFASEQGNIRYIRVVPSDVADTEEEVEHLHTLYTEKGYEGAMIKQTGIGCEREKNPRKKELCVAKGAYKCKRCNNTMKYKHFSDTEATIVGVYEGQGQDKGSAVFEVTAPNGEIYSVRMAAPKVDRQEWFAHPERVLGKPLTIRHKGWSIYGIPVHATGVAIRDYE